MNYLTRELSVSIEKEERKRDALRAIKRAGRIDFDKLDDQRLVYADPNEVEWRPDKEDPYKDYNPITSRRFGVFEDGTPYFTQLNCWGEEESYIWVPEEGRYCYW